MNTTIQNPVAAVASITYVPAATNRPVTYADIAAKLGMSPNTVCTYMNPKYPSTGKGVQLVRKTAEEMGYDKQAVLNYTSRNMVEKRVCSATCECGKVYQKKSGSQAYCPECAKAKRQEYRHVYIKVRNGRSMNYRNGNFKTREEEVARMKELRELGYSNAEIAKAVGRSEQTVRNAIGKQDYELWRQNIAMGAHIRAQKNAARKQYLLNKPIREYNAKVEAHNKLKAQVAQMEAELKPQTPIMEQASQIQINFPLVDLRTVQPTALQ